MLQAKNLILHFIRNPWQGREKGEGGKQYNENSGKAKGTFLACFFWTSNAHSVT